MSAGAGDAIDRLAHRELTETRVPGAAIAVTAPDGGVDVRVYGRADLGTGQPVTADTMFEIGSIGKTFTALVVLQLVEEGRLDLHAPVADVLPWFEMPANGRAVTIHDLLTHTAGITAGTDGTPEAAAQVWALRDRRPAGPPGQRFHYSNVGYKILGLVIETVEGCPYPDAVRRRILEPLAMTATEPDITHDLRARLAVGYDYLHDDRIGYPGRPLAPATWVETATADGSIASTAGDMAAFARMLLRRGEGPGGRLVSEPTFERMTAPNGRPDAEYWYGYGLITRTVGGRSFLGHPGGMIGYVAAVQVDPASGYGVAALMNGLMGRPVTLARAILAELAGGPATPPVQEREAPPEATGVYRADGGDRWEIVAGPSGPQLRLNGESVELEPLGDGRYVPRHRELDRFVLSFEPADGAPPVGWHGSTRLVRESVNATPLPAPAPAVARVAGHYRSHNPWITNFRVILRGDVPWLVFAAAPDGFEDEQPLIGVAENAFRVGEDPLGPEDLRFDAVVEGRPLRAWLSGYPYYRVG